MCTSRLQKVSRSVNQVTVFVVLYARPLTHILPTLHRVRPAPHGITTRQTAAAAAAAAGTGSRRWFSVGGNVAIFGGDRICVRGEDVRWRATIVTESRGRMSDVTCDKDQGTAPGSRFTRNAHTHTAASQLELTAVNQKTEIKCQHTTVEKHVFTHGTVNDD